MTLLFGALVGIAVLFVIENLWILWDLVEAPEPGGVLVGATSPAEAIAMARALWPDACGWTARPLYRGLVWEVFPSWSR